MNLTSQLQLTTTTTTTTTTLVVRDNIAVSRTIDSQIKALETH